MFSWARHSGDSEWFHVTPRRIALVYVVADTYHALRVDCVCHLIYKYTMTLCQLRIALKSTQALRGRV